MWVKIRDNANNGLGFGKWYRGVEFQVGVRLGLEHFDGGHL